VNTKWQYGTSSNSASECLCALFARGASLSAARAHLQAWFRAGAAVREQLLVEMRIVQGWIDEHKPNTPPAARSWSWWVRQAEPWDRARRASARAAAPCDSSIATALPLGEDIELRPLVTALELY
jgi:hypothetical protein